MTYYRWTRTSNPMSDWGHAMFADADDRWSGAFCHILNSSDCTPISTLMDDIKVAWTTCQADEYFGQTYLDEYTTSLDADDVAQLFDPEDIVNSAGGWDSELVCWFWEFVAEPNGILAVSTNDGAVAFDATVINTL